VVSPTGRVTSPTDEAPSRASDIIAAAAGVQADDPAAEEVPVATAFLLTPFSPEAAGGEKPSVYRKVQQAIALAAELTGVELRRADSIFKGGVIIEQVREAIDEADVIIAVCTGKNANVFYELGLAEASGHEPILVAPNARHLPFDKAHCRCHMYGTKRETVQTLPQRLAQAITETLTERSRTTRPVAPSA